MKLFLKLSLGLLVCGCLWEFQAFPDSAADSSDYAAPQKIGEITDASLAEISGIARYCRTALLAGQQSVESRHGHAFQAAFALAAALH